MKILVFGKTVQVAAELGCFTGEQAQIPALSRAQENLNSPATLAVIGGTGLRIF